MGEFKFSPKRLISKQRGIKFIYCASPITIDKSEEWGPNNFQIAKNGAFLKMKNENEISHLVQPNSDNTAPIGWVQTGVPGYFDKAPIYISEELEIGMYSIKTLDGLIDYTVTEPSVICYNEKDGNIDLDDCWIQTIEEIEKNYELPRDN